MYTANAPQWAATAAQRDWVATLVAWTDFVGYSNRTPFSLPPIDGWDVRFVKNLRTYLSNYVVLSLLVLIGIMYVSQPCYATRHSCLCDIVFLNCLSWQLMENEKQPQRWHILDYYLFNQPALPNFSNSLAYVQHNTLDSCAVGTTTDSCMPGSWKISAHLFCLLYTHRCGLVCQSYTHSRRLLHCAGTVVPVRMWQDVVHVHWDKVSARYARFAVSTLCAQLFHHHSPCYTSNIERWSNSFCSSCCGLHGCSDAQKRNLAQSTAFLSPSTWLWRQCVISAFVFELD